MEIVFTKDGNIIFQFFIGTIILHPIRLDKNFLFFLIDLFGFPELEKFLPDILLTGKNVCNNVNHTDLFVNHGFIELFILIYPHADIYKTNQRGNGDNEYIYYLRNKSVQLFPTDGIW